MIEVVNVTKKFGDFTAIQDLNFKVSDGWLNSDKELIYLSTVS